MNTQLWELPTIDQLPAQARPVARFTQAIQNSTTTTILLVLGIALPWVAHRFDIGMAFLPLHLPLLMGCFLLPLVYALLLALMIPLLNTALIGMPVLFPVLPMIVIELMVYVLAIKYLYQIKHYNFFVSLITSLFLGRVAITIAALAFGSFVYSGFGKAVAYFGHLFADFMPGLILQLLVISILALQFVLPSNKQY